MTIRTRLALLFTVAVLVLVAGGSVLFVKRLGEGLDQSLDGRLATRANSIVSDLHRPGNDLSTDFIARLPLGNTNGIYAQLLTTEGVALNTSRGLHGQLLIPASLARSPSLFTRPASRDSVVQILGPDSDTAEQMRLYVIGNARPNLVIVVAISREVVEKAVDRATQQLVILCGLVLLLAGPAAWLLTRAALRPVERMRRQVAGMRADEVGSGLAIPRTRDEVARLATTFNGLLSRLSAAVEREKAFVSDAGHELRTPLAVLKGELELAQNPNRTVAELRETVSVAAEETERLVRLAEDLLLLARDDEAPTMRLTQFLLVPLIDQAIHGVTTMARARDIEIRFDAVDVIEVHGEPDRIRRVMDNLLTNAIRHTPAGGCVQVRAETIDADVLVTVSDDGPGFPPSFLPTAFDRFTRADTGASRPSAPTSGGNGLGLAIVRSVLAGHGGTVRAANRREGGAILTLRWPKDASVVRLRPLL
ncbi:MAG: ATP-binding protein [Jatrophihabitantaceae bacterium]